MSILFLGRVDENSPAEEAIRVESVYAVLTVAGTCWGLDIFLGIAALPMILTARFIARAITAMYRELKIPVLKSEVLKPAKAPVTVFVFAITAMVRPEPIPASSPTMSASFLNQPVYKPRKSEGSSCRMRTPPRSWSCIAYVAGTAKTNPRAMNLNIAEAHFAI